jgi:hypothetical protein
VTSKRSLTAAALIALGVVFLAVGIYLLKFSLLCGQGEPAAVCARSWIGAIGPIIAVAALFVALGQYSLSRDTAQKQIRAYVGVVDGAIQLVNLTTEGQGISALLRLKNSGRSPAYQFTTWIAQPVIAEPNAEPFGEPLPLEDRTSASVMFSEADVQVSRATPISNTDLAALRNGTKKLFIWGGADYTDAFGVRRTLRFHDVNGEELGQASGRWPVKPHRRGYQAD